MRHVLTAAALALASPAGAESLCDRSDAAALLALLSGSWTGAVEVWVEADTISTGRDVPEGGVVLGGNGLLDSAFLDGLGAGPVPLTLGQVYDVDGVDDLLDTTESAWMADDLSDTPCGPEALPQFSGTIDAGPDLTGTATLIAYFDDRVLMLYDLEARGDWGFAEVTGSSLLSRE